MARMLQSLYNFYFQGFFVYATFLYINDPHKKQLFKSVL